MPTTPATDDQGRELLPDDQYHALVMMDGDEFDAQPEEIKAKFGPTNAYHFRQRMNYLDLDSIQTGDGMTYREKLAYYQSMQSQKPSDLGPKDY
jgi:hypothetical protein